MRQDATGFPRLRGACRFVMLGGTLLLAPAAACAQAASSQNEAPAASTGTANPAQDQASDAFDIGECPDTASGFDQGATYSCSCPPLIRAATIYGTGTYTQDSNICEAALHSGILHKGAAGRVAIHVVTSPPVFKSTTQNGIKSQVWLHSTSAAFQIEPAQ